MDNTAVFICATNAHKYAIFTQKNSNFSAEGHSSLPYPISTGEGEQTPLPDPTSLGAYGTSIPRLQRGLDDFCVSALQCARAKNSAGAHGSTAPPVLWAARTSRAQGLGVTRSGGSGEQCGRGDCERHT